MSFQVFTLAQDCSFDGLDDRECRLYEATAMATSAAAQPLKAPLRPCLLQRPSECYKSGIETGFAPTIHSVAGLDNGQFQHIPSIRSTI